LAENRDLWARLLELCEIHAVHFEWVRGHNGHRENERCDMLARQGSMREPLLIDTEYEDQAGLHFHKRLHF